jgi:hypothetical protein
MVALHASVTRRLDLDKHVARNQIGVSSTHRLRHPTEGRVQEKGLAPCQLPQRRGNLEQPSDLARDSGLCDPVGFAEGRRVRRTEYGVELGEASRVLCNQAVPSLGGLRPAAFRGAPGFADDARCALASGRRRS